MAQLLLAQFSTPAEPGQEGLLDSTQQIPRQRLSAARPIQKRGKLRLILRRIKRQGKKMRRSRRNPIPGLGVTREMIHPRRPERGNIIGRHPRLIARLNEKDRSIRLWNKRDRLNLAKPDFRKPLGQANRDPLKPPTRAPTRSICDIAALPKSA